MNITIFGGSFNPPTLGHEIVIDQIFKLKLIPNLDELWLLPEYQHSFDKNRTLVDAKHRLNMTKYLLRPKVKLVTACIDQQMSGNTIEHVNYLKRKYPKYKFSFLMGSDNLKAFDLWPQWQRLLKLMTFYIYPREGFSFKPLYPGMKPLTHPQQVITNISSTMVRQFIREKRLWEHLVPKKISHYIEKNRLYCAD
jgi:nicotinate-nucleotide adenylyltransferase